MLRDDPLRRVLFVDLSTKSYHVEERPEIFEGSLGGAGAAIRLLDELCPKGCDPCADENPVIFAVGPLTGLFPLASKTVAFFKSPLTGNLGESHCGGRSAVAIRMAGYGGIVITGRSDIPIYLSIDSDGVGFKDARSLWGMGSTSTVGRIIRENESAPGLRTIMRIGRAGEKLVRYAGVTTETYRHFGRLGLGAVFGAKKLKAVVVSGKRSLPVTDPKSYREFYEELYRAAVGSELMRKYHDVGTAENIVPLNSRGGLPTRNLQSAKFEGAQAISGEAMAEDYLGRRLACSHCPVGCIHIAALREPYEDEPYFTKTHMICYDYEPIYALGPMLGIASPRDILLLMERIEALGLDVMSAGVVLAWATEAREKQLISEEETEGIRFAWGDARPYMDALEKIVDQPNAFYRALALGVRRASERFGGEDFALSYGGNEMPGYHTGPGAHAGYLLGLRHSHLDNAGYGVDQKILSERELPPQELARLLVDEEVWRQVLASLVICFFARGIYTRETVSRALQLCGFDLGTDDLEPIGRRIYRQKHAFKEREGFSLGAERYPKRIFETPSPSALLEQEYMDRVTQAAVEYVNAMQTAEG